MAEPTEAKSGLINQLLAVATAYCSVRDSSPSSVSKAIFGRGGHLADLQAGERDISTGTYERAMRWFSVNWPADSDWPEGVDRPMPEAAE